jgi:hypothetical protein
MPRRIADLLEELHAGSGLDYTAIFARYESELLG